MLYYHSALAITPLGVNRAVTGDTPLPHELIMKLPVYNLRWLPLSIPFLRAT